MLFPRNLQTDLLEATKVTPVVLINGARQTGKSTLAVGMFPPDNRPRYISLDDIATLGLAKSSPKSFIQGIAGPVIIDEIQRAPELFLPIKEAIDKMRKPGRFILTGSANVLSLPKLADSLAGRMEIYTLWPLSRGELEGQQESFIDTVFSKQTMPNLSAIEMHQLIQALVAGGYPNIQSRTSTRLRENWYTSYITSLLERDVRELSNIEGLTELPNLLSLLASRAGGLMNLSDVSRSLELSYMTLKRYLALLQAVYVVVELPAWANNLGKRLVKSPKLYINDTGLLCHLIGRDAAALESNKPLLGSVFENFVVMELMKQTAWSTLRPKLYHYRTSDGRYEVDLVLEARDGRVVGVECKSSSTVTKDNFKGLYALREDAGSKFIRGVVLYSGSNTLRFDDKMEAVPVSALWQVTSKPSPPLNEPEDLNT